MPSGLREEGPLDAFMGLICNWAPNFAPRGWAFCQGQLLPVAQQTAMFSLLGTTYGGNGQTTFALPNLLGRVAVTVGQAPGGASHVQGEAGGSDSVTMMMSQMPMHTHTAMPNLTGGAIPATTAAATVAGPGNGNIPAGLSGETSDGLAVTVNGYAPASTANTTLPAGHVTGTITVGMAGGSQPLPIMQPYLVLQSIICLQGIFPSRN